MKEKILPVEYRVLVRLDPVKDTAGEKGVIYMPQTTKDREQHAQVAGILEAVSEMAFEGWNGTIPKVGDHVLVAKYAGMTVPGPDSLLRICNDKEIAAVIIQEE